MTEPKLFFFRNDDVRGEKDESLVKLIEIFIDQQVPISLAVEPANLSAKVVDWLLFLKNAYPELIEIVQHGYAHKLHYIHDKGGKIRKGEFGGNRTYEEQCQDILSGKQLMHEYFGNQWFPLFVFPYSGRNSAAIKALDSNGFLAMNGGMNPKWNFRVFSFCGRLLCRDSIFGKKISYNLRNRPGTNLMQIDTGISINKQFIDEQTNATFYNLNELKSKTTGHLKVYKTLGFVMHHRYHTHNEHFDLVNDLIVWLKSLPDTRFVKQEYIYTRYASKN